MRFGGNVMDERHSDLNTRRWAEQEACAEGESFKCGCGAETATQLKSWSGESE
jgi:hypothetical protein